MAKDKKIIVTVRRLSTSAMAGTIMALLSQNQILINSRKKEWRIT
ncbi:hypothetical protein [Heyndrickxia ginsengihumi]|nr:hypothetical protein [Heyndrickxia ginsengihumi]